MKINKKDKVLVVDDEVNILDSYRRSLKNVVEIETAISGKEALEVMDAKGSFAVVVSDMQMPGMNGVEFLAKAKCRAPDTVRMMLTGNADQQTAIDAVTRVMYSVY
jgi:DNA-binding NtrC family response regulator